MGTEIITNQTEYSDGAGGVAARVLVLRSTTVSLDELELQIASSFDADPDWRGEGSGDTRLWRHGESCQEHRARSNEPTAESTTAHVSRSKPGDTVLIAQFDEVLVNEPSVIVTIGTMYHQFCNVGTAIR